MSKGLFRKVALERLASPEQLDQLVTVTNTRAWLSLLAVVVILVTVVSWGFYGNIPTRTYGQGILLESGGIYNLVHCGEGRLTDISVKAGDYVKRGDVLARVEQYPLVEEINDLNTKLAQLKGLKATVLGDVSNREAEIYRLQQVNKQNQGGVSGLTIDEEYNNLKHELIGARIEYLQKHINLEDKRADVERFTKLYESGAVPEVELTEEKTALALLELDTRATAVLVEKILSTIEAKARDIERDISKLQEKLKFDSTIVSEEDGRVIEVKANRGDIIETDMPIISIEKSSENDRGLEVVLYVPAEVGKNILPGMEAQISPTIVKKEEQGFLLGKVVSISEYPATPQGMLRTLGNQDLVKELSGRSVPLEVRIDLIVDKNTLSGFKWSSHQGPPLKLSSGTLCTGSVTVKEQKPVSLVIPVLKKYLPF